MNQTPSVTQITATIGLVAKQTTASRYEIWRGFAFLGLVWHLFQDDPDGGCFIIEGAPTWYQTLGQAVAACAIAAKAVA